MRAGMPSKGTCLRARCTQLETIGLWLNFSSNRSSILRMSSGSFDSATQRNGPIARANKRPILWYQGFSDMENVMGHGGQLASFEACFSERGKEGNPKRLWDRKTGKIDTDVAKSWEKYDIRLVLERNWKELGPKLKGKLHVYMGEEDSFYLEGATKLLKESLTSLKSDAKAELFLSGPSIVGLAFTASKALILATSSALYRANVGIDGRKLP